MREIYEDEILIFQNEYKRTIYRTLIIGIIVALFFYVISFYFQDFILAQMEYIASGVGKTNEITNVQKFFMIIKNNIIIGAVIILMGLIPIYRLSTLYALFSFAGVGVVMGYGQIMKEEVLKSFIIAFLPHAIIEVFAILFSIAIATYINKNMIRKVFFRKKVSVPFKLLFVQIIKSYLLIVVPLFVLAGIVEAFLTSLLVDLYLR